MIVCKKRIKYVLLAVLSLLGTGNIIYGADETPSKEEIKLNYELKLGITPYETYGGDSRSESFRNGLDFGMEVYRSFEKYSIGFGGEVKGKLEKDYVKEDGERLYTYYILAKRKIGKSYSLVARLGRTSQKEFDSKYYIAAGIEKSFGRFNVQLLTESTKLKNNYYDKDYNMIGLKFGYVFGDISSSTPKVDMPVIIPPAENIELPPEPVFKLIIEGDELTGGYEAYKTQIPIGQIENIQDMTNVLNEYDKPGILELKAYSDNTGSKELNVRLANERMDNLIQEFSNNGLIEKINIMKIDPRETVKNEYKVDNDTFENRKLNRRIEVNFYEDEDNM